MCLSALSPRLHNSVACKYRHVLGKKHVQQTFLADSCADYCGCWCLPMLLPRSFRHPLHISLVLRRNCCRSAHVVPNGHTSLGAVVHGKRGCFSFSKGLRPMSGRCSLAGESRKAGAPSPCRCSRSSSHRAVGRLGAPGLERLERVLFPFLVEPLGRPCAVWSQVAALMFACCRCATTASACWPLCSVETKRR